MKKGNTNRMSRFKQYALLLCLLSVLEHPALSQRKNSVLTNEEAALLGYDTTMHKGMALQLNASAGWTHFGAGAVAGYRFDRHFFLGIGVEPSYTKGWLYSLIANASGYYSLPVFLDAKCYLTKKSVAPYFELRAGYAFPLHKVDRHIDPSNNNDMLQEQCVYDREEVQKGIYTGIGFGIKVRRSDFSIGVIVNEMYYHHLYTYENGSQTENSGVDLCPNAYCRYAYTLSAQPKASEQGAGPAEVKDLHKGVAYRLNASVGLLDLPWMLIQHKFGHFGIGGTVGYQLSPIAYLGVGAEYYVSNQTYSGIKKSSQPPLTGNDYLLRCVPLFADARVCFSQRVKSLFAEMRLGYSVPLGTTVAVVYGEDFFARQEGLADVSDDFIRGELGKQINGLFGGLGLGYKVGRSAYSIGINVLGTKCYHKSYYEDGVLRYDENDVTTNVYFRYGITLQ